jgi:hypothetical protein
VGTDLAECMKLPNLNTLGLNGCTSLTDRCLEWLAQLPALQKANLQGCPKVSREALHYLETLSPRVEIYRERHKRMHSSATKDSFFV